MRREFCVHGPRAKYWAGKSSGKTVENFNKSLFSFNRKYMIREVEI